MRLPTRKVYRAFRELDRFADGQCELFVRAAKQGTARRIRRGILQSVVALLGLACGTAATFGILYALYHEDINAGRAGRSDLEFDFIFGLWGVLGFGGAGLGWLLSRDLLLRRRIRRVLGTRGSCAMCGYGLVGLPVSPELLVVCPECGYRSVAEPSLGEVVVDAAGEKRFLPSPDVVSRLWRWLTPQVKKRLARWSLRAGVAILALLVLGAGGYEWFIRWQAGVAQRARTGAEELTEFLEKCQITDGGRDKPDAWDAFDAAVSAELLVDSQTWQAALAKDPGAPAADISEIYAPSDTADQTNAARTQANRRAARQALEDYRAAGVFARLDEMAARRPAVRPPGLSAGQTLTNLGAGEVGPARQLARINKARMKLAADADDLPEFISAFEANLAIVRMLEGQRLMIDRLVAVALTGLNFETMKGVLATHPDADWIVAVRRALGRKAAAVPYHDMFKSAEFAALDTIAWLFSDPDRARGGRFSPKLSAAWRPLGIARFEKPMRTYVANREAAKALFEQAMAQVDLDPWERGPNWVPAEPQLDPLATFVGELGSYIRCADQDRLYVRALETELALEEFLCSRRVYPDSLDDLVPRHLARLPLDPWSGRPFGYRRLATGADGKPRYLLYSVGADGIDDGGKGPPRERDIDALNGKAPGTDFVISPDWGALPGR